MGKFSEIVFLVIDDSKISRKWLIEMIPPKILEHATIIEGTNGQEAIDLYKEHQPDLVFMDITMPIMNGIEALQAIKALNNDAMIIMISADRQKSTQERVLTLGASAVLAKPVNADEFRATLLKLVF
ncbi:MAG: response regulator [Sulfurospirillaceae bacterium]|jgi:two-component system chemotaxis response regulator CheY|nr:response regulator [Sulfurospirillaceae bacterium]MDD2827124.1 response regulator [Sulfurospirillaceae bacterium]